jgi:hypothetical protein
MSTVTQNHIEASTPKGGNLVSGGGIIQGATFRVWAPRAKSIYLNGRFNNTDFWAKDTNPSLALQRIGGGDWWGGFVSDAREGDAYKFYVVGENGSGYKRDPYARELSVDPPFPNANCILRAPGAFPWQGDAFQTPDYANMIIYQAHAATFYSKIANAGGTFLALCGIGRCKMRSSGRSTWRSSSQRLPAGPASMLPNMMGYGLGCGRRSVRPRRVGLQRSIWMALPRDCTRRASGRRGRRSLAWRIMTWSSATATREYPD